MGQATLDAMHERFGTGKQQGVCAGGTGGIGLDGHGRGRGSAHCVDMKEEYGML